VRRAFLTLWGPFLAALIIVFWLSSLPHVPGAQHFWDKLLHAVGYAVLGVLALRAFHGGFSRPRLEPILYAALVVIVWGISDEFHQSFVPGRDASGWDVLADVVGFLIAVLVFATLTLTSRSARIDRPR
jgi:VanZ family protein